MTLLYPHYTNQIDQWAEALQPSQLNGGNLVDIFQNREAETVGNNWNEHERTLRIIEIWWWWGWFMTLLYQHYIGIVLWHVVTHVPWIFPWCPLTILKVWQDDFEAVETMEVSYTSSSGEKAFIHSCCDLPRDSRLKVRFHKHMWLSTSFNISGHTSRIFILHSTQMGILTREFARSRSWSLPKTPSRPSVDHGSWSQHLVHAFSAMLWPLDLLDLLDLLGRGKQGEYDAPGHLCPLSEGTGPHHASVFSSSTCVVAAGWQSDYHFAGM